MPSDEIDKGESMTANDKVNILMVDDQAYKLPQL